MLKKIKLEEAIGMPIGHDVTKVVPGEFKGAAFRRGHILKRDDIPELLSMGKEHIYVIEEEEGEIHEEEAARRIATAVAEPELEISQPKEGKVNIKSTISGLLKINKALLKEINSVASISLATLHENSVCRPGTIVAGTKIIPLYIPEEKIEKIEKLCQVKGKVCRVIPFQAKKVGVVITGNELYKGRIKDKFGDYIKNKVEPLGSSINHQRIVPDDEDIIAEAILEMQGKGSEVIFVCSGLSVDPDDVTVEGVERSGATIISYGAPVMPGAMFLYATLDNIPILGAPAAVIFNDTTIIDIILPRVLAGDQLSRQDIIDMGHGGLCLDCGDCVYPICPFCK
ncbi:MAG: molybdopterin-binding protein [Dehalococcoidia bacterium]|nr:MAG: molybdopterin-binding protein [Dehalococcoidia bacterium]